MSRSSPNLQNPANHLYEWNGETGTLSYYDKDQGKTIEVPFSEDKPFEMLILDQLNGVGGWSDQHNIGLWSTEVRSGKDDLTVFAGRRAIYSGPYKDKQGINQVAGFGGRYCKIVYFAHKEAGNWHISRFKLIGVSVSSWIDFTSEQGQKIDEGKVLLVGSTEGKKGKVIYQKPSFAVVAATVEENEQAVALDRLLQRFLNSYLVTPHNDDSVLVDEIDDSDTKATPEQLADFEKRKADKLTNTPLKADYFPSDDDDFASLMQTGMRADDIPEDEIPFK